MKQTHSPLLFLLVLPIIFVGIIFLIDTIKSSKQYPMRPPQTIFANKLPNRYVFPYYEPTQGLTEKRFSGRSYYIHTPPPSHKKPSLILLLHGAKRTGASMIDNWKFTADRNNIILLAPTAPQKFWLIDHNEMEKLMALVGHVQKQHGIDTDDTYIFGHSSGANMTIAMAAHYSHSFAAASLHAGAYPPEYLAGIKNVKTNMPIVLITGTKDSKFPLENVRATAKALHDIGMYVIQYEVKSHTHWYYSISQFINENAWKAMTATY